MVDWGRRWSQAGDEAIRRADAELDSGRLAAACESYLAAARWYWMGLSGRALHAADRRALEDAHAAAFRAAVPMLPQPTTPFTLQVDDVEVAGYLFLPSDTVGVVPTVLWRAELPGTVESSYWQVALPILDSGVGCAYFVTTAAPPHTAVPPDTAAGGVTRWLQQQPGVGDVVSLGFRAGAATPPSPLRRNRP